MTDVDRLRLAIDKWGQALIMEIQWLREAIVAQNISICESCANNPCNKKAMLGDRRIYECTLYERAEQTEPYEYEILSKSNEKVYGTKAIVKTEPTCSEKPNNCDEPQTCRNCKWSQTVCRLGDNPPCHSYEPKDEPQTDCAWK